MPARIHVLPLPPYSPELNPVEAIGNLIKDRIGNTLSQTLEAMEEAIGEELRPLWEKLHPSPAVAATLVGAPGRPSAVTAGEGVDAGPFPAAFVAETVNV